MSSSLAANHQPRLVGGKEIDSVYILPCAKYWHFSFSVQHAYYLDYKVVVLSSSLFYAHYLCLKFNKFVLIYQKNICGSSFLMIQDDRRMYVTNFMDHLVSWHTVTLRMMRAEAFVNLGEPNIPVAWDVMDMTWWSMHMLSSWGKNSVVICAS